MAETTTFVKTIAETKRLRLSTMGNPRLDVTFTDGTSAITQSNASVAYDLENPDFRGVPVRFTLSRAGRITLAEIVRDGES